MRFYTSITYVLILHLWTLIVKIANSTRNIDKYDFQIEHNLLL